MSSLSVPARDIIRECEQRGYLAMQLYAVFTHPLNGMEPVMSNLAAHLQYQEDLETSGVMFAAGPHWTDDGEEWRGDGMIIYRAGSLAEARAIAERDPMHASGARSFTIRPWLVNEGKITLEIGFATGRFKLR